MIFYQSVKSVVHLTISSLQPAVFAILLLGATVLPGLAEEPLMGEGERKAATHTIVFTEPAGDVPTNGMPDGPLLGNGDIGVVQAGPPGALAYYIGKNDFWGIKTQAPMAVGQVRFSIPQLAGATFRTEQDLRQAELRGTFAKGDTALATRAWVDANVNLFCIELTNQGAKSIAVTAQNIKGYASQKFPSEVRDNNKGAKLGYEQQGSGRWFFSGEMADIKVHDRALPAAEIIALAQGGRNGILTFDGKSSHDLAVPVISKALTIAGWIKPAKRAKDADYIVSKGEWNQAYSLGLSKGRLRFAVGDFMLQYDDPMPLDQWTHVAAVFDGKQMQLLVDGKVKMTTGAVTDHGDSFLYDPDASVEGSRKLGFASRLMGGPATREFALEPGRTVTLVTAVLTDLDVSGKDPLAEAKALVAALTPDKLTNLTSSHRRWWRDFWNRSFIEIPDKVIEQCWYSSWYIMGSCSRAGKVAPGLWGNWQTTDRPAWHGDFHLNYNFQAPFYGLYSANHPETTLPYYDALNQSIPRGQRIAKQRGWKGIHLPVSIGPWGMCPEGDAADWGQRSNAAFSSLLFIWHWQHTRDLAWLKQTGYAFPRATAEFWEDYLKLENGRYVIYNDSIHEGSGADMNPLLSLGLVRTLFENLIPMSEALGVDADKRAKWRDICAKLSAYPLQQRDGKTVFRYSEKGTAWWNDNTLGIQHIFPAGTIGLDSEPKLLETSRSMIDAMGRWKDFNGSSSWYAACARVGYNPEVILTEMRGMYDGHAMPNKLLTFGGGGIENVSPSLAVTEMLMQSHAGVLRVFPCWPARRDARFGSLRAVGAFLVSAELKGGKISGLKIVSEKGNDCTLVNPWPDQPVQVTRGGRPAETPQGPRFTLHTTAGETLELSPQ